MDQLVRRDGEPMPAEQLAYGSAVDQPLPDGRRSDDGSLRQRVDEAQIAGLAHELVVRLEGDVHAAQAGLCSDQVDPTDKESD